MSSELIEAGGDRRLIFEDKNISRKILDMYNKWKTLERESRRPDKAKSKKLEEKIDTFKKDCGKTFQILVKNWEAVLKKSTIRDSAEDIQHIHNQMQERQIGSVAGVDMKQVKKRSTKRS